MPFLSKNLELGDPLKLSPWRKVAIGTWSAPKESAVYGILELPAEPMLHYIGKLRHKTGIKITVTHFVGKAIALGFKRHPELNSVLRFGKLYPRKSVGVFFQVATDMGGEDLSGTTVYDADQKSVSEIAKELQTRVDRIRTKTDRTFARMKSLVAWLPGFVSYPLMQISSFFMYTLNIWSPLFGTPRDPFGSVMVTSIGSLGFESAFVPIVPFSKIPFILAVGKVKEKAIAEKGQVKAVPIVTLCATFDHRYIDGVHAHHLANTLTEIFEYPEKLLGI